MIRIENKSYVVIQGLELRNYRSSVKNHSPIGIFVTGYGDHIELRNNVIHHVAYPDRFFRGAARVLRPGGHLLIQECNCSWTTRIALRATGHEGYDFSADPFDATRPCNDPSDPWSANCAIPNLLFDDLDRFGKQYPEFAIVESGMSEFFVQFNSGGVTATVPYLPLPWAAMHVVDALDRVLVAVAPGVFASQRRLVLRRS